MVFSHSLIRERKIGTDEIVDDRFGRHKNHITLFFLDKCITFSCCIRIYK